MKQPHLRVLARPFDYAQGERRVGDSGLKERDSRDEGPLVLSPSKYERGDKVTSATAHYW